MTTVQTRPDEPASAAWTPLRRDARWLVALAALVAAGAHLPVIAPHLSEAPYMGEEFIVLTVACTLLAVAVPTCDSVAAYALAALTGALAIAGYLATRMVAFPQLSDDVGNWLEPLGIVSICAEATMLAAALSVLLSPGVRRFAPPTCSLASGEQASSFSSRLSPGSRAGLASGTGGAAWTSSSIRSGGSVRG